MAGPDGTARFDKFHVGAGSPQGGQFASGGSGSSGSGSKPAPGHGAAGHGAAGHGKGSRQQLLEQARHDLAEAATLERQLHILEKQHHAAVASAKHSAAAAAASKKAGKTIQHHHHTAVHKHHAHHAATAAQRIMSLKTRIRDLRHHAAELEKQARSMRSAVTETWPVRWGDAWANGGDARGR